LALHGAEVGSGDSGLDDQSPKPVAAPGETRPGMVWVSASEFTMGRNGPASTADPRIPYAPDSRVQKRGSFLCHADSCSSYRPSEKMATPPDTGMSHLGFRCVLTPQMQLDEREDTGPKAADDS
jgi:formylglycine-generating enzyme required for sulfatase activity